MADLITELRATIEEMRQENAKLRREIQTLRNTIDRLLKLEAAQSAE